MNLAFSRQGRCFVLVQNESPATDEEWSEWVRFVTDAPSPELRVLIVSAGGSPTPKQRRLIHDAIPPGSDGVPSAVVTRSMIGRTVVGLMGMFNRQVRAFAPKQLDEALDYLGVPAARRPELFDLVARLHEQLGLRMPAELAAGR